MAVLRGCFGNGCVIRVPHWFRLEEGSGVHGGKRSYLFAYLPVSKCQKASVFTFSHLAFNGLPHFCLIFLQYTRRMPQFATRLTLCATECLKDAGLQGEAAGRLLLMTSEDSDLRSALLLEEASYCFIRSRKPCMPRKYAFHLVLAGHRYAKAGQKRHSLRCYKQAYQVEERVSREVYPCLATPLETFNLVLCTLGV